MAEMKSETPRGAAMPREGQVLTASLRLEQDAFDAFAAISGDDNPIHVDPSFAEETRFGRPVAHGMLLYGLICSTVRRAWPGARQERQALMFPAPARVRDTVTVEVAFSDVDAAGGRAVCSTVVTRDDGEAVCRGEAVFVWEDAAGEGAGR